TTALCPPIDANESGVRPSSPFELTSTWFVSSSNFTTASFPRLDANESGSGVRPKRSFELSSTWFVVSSNFTTASCPSIEANESGERPISSFE
ncbi:hypothetical protein EV356DRAFT_423686, partial [Viridothelium virens]